MPCGRGSAAGRSSRYFHAKLLEHTDATLRAWGVRAAGNQRTVESAISDRILKLAKDPAPDVRLQVAIAAHKLEGVDAMRLLLDVQQASYRDRLIAPIVWQNLLPSIEARRPNLLSGWAETEVIHPGSPRSSRERSSDCSKARRHARLRSLSLSLPRATTNRPSNLSTWSSSDSAITACLAALRKRFAMSSTSLSSRSLGLQIISMNSATVARAYCGDQDSLTRGDSSGPGQAP